MKTELKKLKKDKKSDDDKIDPVEGKSLRNGKKVHSSSDNEEEQLNQVQKKKKNNDRKMNKKFGKGQITIPDMIRFYQNGGGMTPVLKRLGVQHRGHSCKRMFDGQLKRPVLQRQFGVIDESVQKSINQSFKWNDQVDIIPLGRVQQGQLDQQQGVSHFNPV